MRMQLLHQSAHKNDALGAVARGDQTGGKGISIHIGLAYVSKYGYRNPPVEMPCCQRDAEAMRAIAAKDYTLPNGSFGTNEVLINEQATVSAVISRLTQAAQTLTAGQLLVTFSGHGTYREIDGTIHEAWCLYDTPLFERQFRAFLPLFNTGVEVVVIADACYAGGLTRERSRALALAPEPGRPKQISPESIVALQETRFTPFMDIVKLPGEQNLKAHCVYVGACGTTEKTHSGPDLSEFTNHLVAAWDEGLRDSFEVWETELQKRSAKPPTPEIVAYEPFNSGFLARGLFR